MKSVPVALVLTFVILASTGAMVALTKDEGPGPASTIFVPPLPAGFVLQVGDTHHIYDAGVHRVIASDGSLVDVPIVRWQPDSSIGTLDHWIDPVTGRVFAEHTRIAEEYQHNASAGIFWFPMQRDWLFGTSGVIGKTLQLVDGGGVVDAQTGLGMDYGWAEVDGQTVLRAIVPEESSGFFANWSFLLEPGVPHPTFVEDPRTEEMQRVRLLDRLPDQVPRVADPHAPRELPHMPLEPWEGGLPPGSDMRFRGQGMSVAEAWGVLSERESGIEGPLRYMRWGLQNMGVHSNPMGAQRVYIEDRYDIVLGVQKTTSTLDAWAVQRQQNRVGSAEPTYSVTPLSRGRASSADPIQQSPSFPTLFTLVDRFDGVWLPSLTFKAVPYPGGDVAVFEFLVSPWDRPGEDPYVSAESFTSMSGVAIQADTGRYRDIVMPDDPISALLGIE